MSDEKIDKIVQEYYDNNIGRREFTRLLTLATGSLSAAVSTAKGLGFDLLSDGQVPANDPDLETQSITYPSKSNNGGAALEVKAYIAKPKQNGNGKGVIVIHENRGLNDHIKDVARRLAKKGYTALAPDMLYADGGTDKFETQDQAVAAIRKLDMKQVESDLVAAATYLKSQKSTKVGCVGFCWGGAQSFNLACNSNDISAAVVYYGRCPKADKIKNMQGALLGNFAEVDAGVDASLPEAEAALKEHKKTYEFHKYKAKHAFNNDTSPRYDQKAAEQAWTRTLNWFETHLK